jgi:hypothetical protein
VVVFEESGFSAVLQSVGLISDVNLFSVRVIRSSWNRRNLSGGSKNYPTSGIPKGIKILFIG